MNHQIRLNSRKDENQADRNSLKKMNGSRPSNFTHFGVPTTCAQKYIDFAIHPISSTKQSGYFEYKPMYFHVQQITIRTIDFSNPLTNHTMTGWSPWWISMLFLNKDLQEARTPPHEQTALQRQIRGYRPSDRHPGLRALRADRRGDQNS